MSEDATISRGGMANGHEAPPFSCGETQLLTLPDGRRLAYVERGLADGWPMVLLHGLPGSRLQYPLEPETEARYGVRSITLDRPGVGLSDAKPGRRFADFPADLAALLDHLGIGEFALVGVSGGGPYAMATAIAMPDRVRAMLLASPMGPLAAPNAWAKMSLPIRSVFVTGRYAPWAFRAAIPFIYYGMRLTHGGSGFARRLFLPPDDCRVHASESFQQMFRPDFREAAIVSGRGAYDELRNLVLPWDIDPADVRVPTTLWHGEEDSTVPVTIGRYLAARIPDCQAEITPELGHFFCFERLEAMLRLLQPPAD